MEHYDRPNSPVVACRYDATANYEYLIIHDSAVIWHGVEQTYY